MDNFCVIYMLMRKRFAVKVMVSWWLLGRITGDKPLAEVSRMDSIAVVDK